MFSNLTIKSRLIFIISPHVDPVDGDRIYGLPA